MVYRKLFSIHIGVITWPSRKASENWIFILKQKSFSRGILCVVKLQRDRSGLSHKASDMVYFDYKTYKIVTFIGYLD